MKKQFAFWLLAVVMSSGFVSAQQKKTVYVEEHFDSKNWIFQNGNWDTAATFPLTDGVLYSLDDNMAGGSAPEVLFGYAPNMGLSKQIEGTFGLVTMPKNLMSGNPYVSLKYYYQGGRRSEKDARSFGIAARLKGETEWTECAVVDSLPVELGPTVLSARLPDRFINQSGVQVFVFLKTTKDNTQFLWIFDDIEFYTLVADYYAADLNLVSPVNMSAESVALDFALDNTGNKMDSCKITYRIGEGEEAVQAYVFESGIMPGLSSRIKLDLGALAYGQHDLQVWVSEVNGVAIAEADIDKAEYRLNNVDPSETYDWKLLVESFTSATCGPCATINRRINPAFDSLGNDIALVKYQMNWPGSGDKYYNRNGGSRREFYGVQAVPSMFMNGMAYPLATNLTTASYLRDVRAAMGAYNKTFFHIEIEKAHIDTTTNELEIAYRIDSKGLLANATIETAVIEKRTYNNKGSNGEKEFHHVMMTMLPGRTGLTSVKTGVSVDIKYDTAYTFSYKCDMGTTKMERTGDLMVVCFIQGEDGIVWQAELRDVDGGSMRDLNVANESALVYENLEVYPNPASDQVYLHGLEAATVEVYDMTGRKMLTQTGVSGDYTLDVQAYTPGIYVIKVREGAKVATARISVVR